MRLLDSYAQPHMAANAGTPRTARQRLGGMVGMLGLGLLACDLIALGLAGWAASAVTVAVETGILHKPAYTDLDHGAAIRQNVFLLLCLCSLVMFWAKGLYSRRVPWWSQVQYIGKTMMFVLLIDGFISFAFRFYESRLLIAMTWCMALPSILTCRYFACLLAARVGLWKIPAVLIGDNMTVTDLIYAFHADPCAGYDVHTVFLRDRDAGNFDLDGLPPACRHIAVHDGAFGYEAYIRQHPREFYIVSFDAFRGDIRESLLATLDEVKANYAIVPAIARAGLYDMEPHYFFGHDVMLLQRRAQGVTAPGMQAARRIKRAFDIAVAGAALLVLMPIMAAAALALRIEGQGGSLLYGGMRVGLNGRVFSCWKFRSMEPDSDHLLHAYLDANPQARADWDTYRKLPDDPRVTTRTARIMRKLSIDELPQLWNVLIGDMSLVGPRPIMEEEKPYFGDRLKDYIAVRPGVTGLWQVSGRNATSFMRRVHWDSWYVRNWSLWGDIVILLKTPFVLITRHGAH